MFTVYGFYCFETARHRILRFRQSLWLKKYIDLNTEKRTNARNSFENDLF